ncbi:hypothetical protein AS29_002775 [Bacillus sp. SJS]|nr:hypothetical protein AS29_002775 [Bacillus sp. SJS]
MSSFSELLSRESRRRPLIRLRAWEQALFSHEKRWYREISSFRPFGWEEFLFCQFLGGTGNE